MRAFLAFPITVLAATGLAGCAETEAPASQAAQPGVAKDTYELTEKVDCLVPGEGRQTLIYSTCMVHNGKVLGKAGPAKVAAASTRMATEEGSIRFHVPGLEWRRSKKDETASSRYEILTLKGDRGAYPRAQIFYVLLFPGYVYREKRDLEASTKSWHFLEDEDLKFSEEREQLIGLGRVIYRRFSITSASCFAFQSYFGVESGGRNNWGVPMESVEGYYCDRSPFDDALIEAALKTLDVQPEQESGRFSPDRVPDRLKPRVAELLRWIDENESEFERRLSAFWSRNKTNPGTVRVRAATREVIGARDGNLVLRMELRRVPAHFWSPAEVETVLVDLDEDGIRFVEVY